jgi:hypothetical protein
LLFSLNTLNIEYQRFCKRDQQRCSCYAQTSRKEHSCF